MSFFKALVADTLGGSAKCWYDLEVAATPEANNFSEHKYKIYLRTTVFYLPTGATVVLQLNTINMRLLLKR